MKVSATVKSKLNQHHTAVQTEGAPKELHIAPKGSGYGSSVNGAELLLLSLATCYCNDIYREAAKRNIKVSKVEVEFRSEFGAEGEPGFNFNYNVHIEADASSTEIDDLIRHTDKVAEIHNTLRKGVDVRLVK